MLQRQLMFHSFRNFDKLVTPNFYYLLHSVLPLGGHDFCVISQAGGGATAKLQEPRWGHIQGGEMILGSQAGGNCFIMSNCWYFHKMLHLEIYKLFHKRALLGVIALKSLT